METPICDFVRDYCARDALRLHMPGHKGRALLGMEPLDITEFDGADELYAAAGIIRQSEENAARLFGAARTLYSAEGSSLCIRAMLYLALLHARENGLRPAVAAGRNAHKVFLTAAALTGLEVDWLYPESPESLLACGVEPAALESYLDTRERPAAVYVTSPDYLGNLADIRALSAVCRRRGVLLLVDNAHGAYLHFRPRCGHLLRFGAQDAARPDRRRLPALFRKRPGRAARAGRKRAGCFRFDQPVLPDFAVARRGEPRSGRRLPRAAFRDGAAHGRTQGTA